MAALSSLGASYWLLLYMVGGMQMPVGEPGTPGEGRLSCLNFGKSHSKDAPESWHCTSAKSSPGRHVLIGAVCLTGKESAFHRVGSWHRPRELTILRIWRVSGTPWC